jgi:hypothetical protein
MLEDVLVYMAQAGKDIFSAREIAAALGVPEKDVIPLYRQARDRGWVRKFSDGPPMFQLTGGGAAEGRRLLAVRGGARPGGLGE